MCFASVLAGCDGIGWVESSDGPDVAAAAGNSPGTSGYSSASSSSLSFDEIIRLSNGGDTKGLEELFKTASGDEADGVPATANMSGPDDMDTLALPASDIRLPEGGEVTLRISGPGVRYSETSQASDDGNVYFLVPKIAVGTNITVVMEVKKANGITCRSGSTEQLVEEGCQLSVVLKPEIPVMKTGDDINSALLSLVAFPSFSASATPPSASSTTVLLSTDDSGTDVVAWNAGGAGYYYAEGFTDKGRKIPLGENASSMFQNMSSLSSVDLSGFDTGNVTDMSYMFSGCGALSSISGLSGFDTSMVVNMSGMFYSCEALTSLDLSSFDTSCVTDMSNMFNECFRLATIYASPSFVTGRVSSSTSMFYDCLSLVGTGGGMAPTEIKDAHMDKAYARLNGAGGQPGYFTAR